MAHHQKETIIKSSLTNHQIYTTSGLDVFRKRETATTGYNGRFKLIKSRLQSANLRNVNRQFLGQRRGGAYNNVTTEISQMADKRRSSSGKNSTRLSRRSVRNAQNQELQYK